MLAKTYVLSAFTPALRRTVLSDMKSNNLSVSSGINRGTPFPVWIQKYVCKYYPNKRIYDPGMRMGRRKRNLVSFGWCISGVLSLMVLYIWKAFLGSPMHIFQAIVHNVDAYSYVSPCWGCYLDRKSFSITKILIWTEL